MVAGQRYFASPPRLAHRHLCPKTANKQKLIGQNLHYLVKDAPAEGYGKYDSVQYSLSAMTMKDAAIPNPPSSCFLRDPLLLCPCCSTAAFLSAHAPITVLLSKRPWTPLGRRFHPSWHSPPRCCCCCRRRNGHILPYRPRP